MEFKKESDNAGVNYANGNYVKNNIKTKFLHESFCLVLNNLRIYYS